MKYCEHCKKEFNTNEPSCPVCGTKLSETANEVNEENECEAAEIITTMMVMGIL